MTVQEQFGRRVSNIVFMGMGEPLLNLAAVRPAIAHVNTVMGIGMRHITVSTVGASPPPPPPPLTRCADTHAV